MRFRIERGSNMAGQNLINTLKTRIEGKEKTAAQLLKKLVAIPSVSGSESEMQTELHLLFSGLKGESSLIPIPESLRADPNFASGISVPFEGRPQTRYLWKGAGGEKVSSPAPMSTWLQRATGRMPSRPGSKAICSSAAGPLTTRHQSSRCTWQSKLFRK